MDGQDSSRTEMAAPEAFEAQCPITPSATPPPSAAEEKCCPACPQCPQCPQCPSSEISSVTKRLLEKETQELEKELEKEKEEELSKQRASMTAVTAGVGVTLALLLIASAVVNVILFMKLNKSSGGGHFDKGGDVELSSTPVPASETRV